VKKRTTGYAEKLKEISENCKKNWHFVLKAVLTSRQVVAGTLRVMAV
jgi:hypothetical protein